MPAHETFELIILGGGKGGKTLAVDQGRAGRRVALIERGMIGGSCINVACIPTKTFVQSARLLHHVRGAGTYGIRTGPAALDWPQVQKRVDSVIAEMVTMNLKNFESAPGKLEFILGSGRFAAPGTVEVKTADGKVRRLKSDHIVINTGSRPSRPTIAGLEAGGCLDSETIQRLAAVPEHLIVLGGGHVGLEFAQIFRRFGSRVTMLVRGAQILTREDADVAEALAQVLRAEGIDLRLGAAVQRAEKIAGGVSLSVRAGDDWSTLVGSHVLAALGRSPNTEELNLAVAGVETDARGFVQVNGRLETSAAGIWAVGDVNGGPQFTHASFDDYRILKSNLYQGGTRTTQDRHLPVTLFTEPELARIGLTEREARRQGRTFRVAKIGYGVIPRSKTSGESAGLMKALVDQSTQRILGATILGSAAGELIGIIQMAMISGLPYTVLRDAPLAHPTFSEGFNALFSSL